MLAPLCLLLLAADPPLLGSYKIVEDSPGSLHVGTLLFLTKTEIAAFNSPTEWARMPVKWEKPDATATLVGKLKSGERIDVKRLEPGRVVVFQDGLELGTAVTTSADVVKTFASLPTFDATLEITRQCLDAFKAALPDDPTFESVKLETFNTTASALGMLGLAQVAFARTCRPLPKACSQLPTGHELEAAKQRQRCR
ncbi:MAG: hypothetical protein IPJ65_12670 [Archangiaceae bacterium]|nr:hypothetical protein [Archangiaceae bacterium]